MIDGFGIWEVDETKGKFDDLREVIPFDVEPPPNAPPTEKVSEQYFCRLDRSGWQENKGRIAALVREVDEQWRNKAEQP